MDEIQFKNKFKFRLLETLDYITYLCEKYNFQWWGGYGTCLGAIRHNGIIPWDDDIDICMLRCDYEKLLSISDEIKNDGYDIISGRTNTHCNSFVKICNRKTSLVSCREVKIDESVFIDIFPLDDFDGNLNTFNILYNRLSFYTRLYKLCCLQFNKDDLKYYFLQKNYNRVFVGLLCNILPDRIKNFAHRKVRLLDCKISSLQNGNFLVSFYGPYGVREIWDKEWFEDFLLVDFEDRKIRVPKSYDKYLRNIYNNYMVPPSPIPESTHPQLYVNLKENISLDEIFNKVSKHIFREI